MSGQLSQLNGQYALTFFLQVSWNSDKEKHLWEVASKSPGSESGTPGCECILSLPRVPLTLVPYQWLGKVLATRLDDLLPPSVFSLSSASKVWARPAGSKLPMAR